MQNVLFTYVRTSDRHPFACFAVTKQGDQLALGWSLCHKDDHFTKKLARRIALGRMHKRADVIAGVAAERDRLPQSLYSAAGAFCARAAVYFFPLEPGPYDWQEQE